MLPNSTNVNKAKYVENLLESFFSESSVYIPNRYIVHIGGEHINKAINELMSADRRLDDKGGSPYTVKEYTFERRGEDGTIIRETQSIKVYEKELEHFLTNHVRESDSGDGLCINMRWACQDVSVPILKPKIETASSSRGIMVDPTKNMTASYVKEYEKGGIITMSVLEQEGMMFYHFFNILTNILIESESYNPTDSIHKLWVKIFLYEQPLMGGKDFLTTPLFEFNSVLYDGMSNLSFSHSETVPSKYKVNLKITSPFQKAFKDEATGMENRIKDEGALRPGMTKGTIFNPGRFIGNVKRRNNGI
jgi:hypothetical protein